MTADKILKKYEDDNEYHFHAVDRKWIIAAMEEYAALRQTPVMRSIPRGANHHHFWIEDDILYESYTTIRGMRFCFKMALENGAYADTDNVSGYLEECIAKEYFS